MQIHDFAYRIRGFVRLVDYATRGEDMVSDTQALTALDKCMIILTEPPLNLVFVIL